MSINLAGAPLDSVGILWPATLSEPQPVQPNCGICQQTRGVLAMINWQYVIVIAIAYFIGARFPMLAQKVGLA